MRRSAKTAAVPMEEEPEAVIIKADAAEAMITVLLLHSVVQADEHPEVMTRVFVRAEKRNKKEASQAQGMLFLYVLRLLLAIGNAIILFFIGNRTVRIGEFNAFLIKAFFNCDAQIRQHGKAF